MNKFLFILSLFSLSLTSCSDGIKGEGDVGLAVDFKIENFDAIKADGSFKMILIPNDSSYVSVQTHKNLIENMDIYVQNKTLHIGEKTAVEAFESYVIYLYYHQDLNKITTAGKVLLETQGIINFDDFELETSDASNVNQFGIIAKEAKITVLDKSEVNVHGETSTLKLKAKDYAKVNLSDFDVRVIDVDLAGEADVEAKIGKELSGRILQNSTLEYQGNPMKDVEVKDNGELLKK